MLIIKNRQKQKEEVNLTVKKLNLLFKIIQKNDFSDEKIIDYRQSNMMVING